MAIRIEVGPRPDLLDARGTRLRDRILRDLAIEVETVRIVDVYTIDKELASDAIERCRIELFTDPLTQVSGSDRPIADAFDWAIEVGYLPGVTDNVGNTSREAIEDLLGVRFSPAEGVYFSEQILVRGPIDHNAVARIAGLRRQFHALLHYQFLPDDVQELRRLDAKLHFASLDLHNHHTHLSTTTIHEKRLPLFPRYRKSRHHKTPFKKASGIGI